MRLLNLTLVGSLCVLPLFFLTSATPVERGSAPALVEEGEALLDAMEEVQSGMRALRKMIKTPDQKDACVELIGNMQKQLASIVTEVPKPFGELSDADRLTWGVDFKRGILATAMKLVDLEEQVLKGEVERAQATYKELGKMKKSGHEKFMPE